MIATTAVISIGAGIMTTAKTIAVMDVPNVGITTVDQMTEVVIHAGK